MSYKYIISPNNINVKYSIYSNEGRRLLMNYIKNTTLLPKNLFLNTPEVLKIKDSKIIIKIDRDAEYIDLKRELKGICTDIVVNEFFKSNESLYCFLSLVYKMFENAINKYKNIHKLNTNDIFFTFKGGNILRIVYKELILELPEIVSINLNKFYKKFFKRSDADFSIYINPNLENYDKIYNDWCNIAYYLQDKIRNIISNNYTKYFDYFKYNRKYSKQILNKQLTNFQKADSLSDPNNKIFYGTLIHNLTFLNNSANEKLNYISLPDFITDNTDQDDTLVRYDIKDSKNSMYISLNKTLEFTSGDGGITKFALIRTKINFNLSIEKDGHNDHINMAGELIDVSIPHRKDKSINEVFENMDRAIIRYTFRNEDEELEFNSYSLEFLIEDLEKILFHVAEFPWDDNKYVKRLNRLCYLYFLDMLIKNKENSIRKIKLRTVLNTINNINNPVFGNKPDNSVLSFSRIIWYFTYVKYKSNNNHNNLLQEFKENIKINLNELYRGFDNIDNYCISGPGNINEDDIYTSSIDELL